jgi:hypothetical protein
MNNTTKLRNIVLLANLTEMATEIAHSVLSKNADITRDPTTTPSITRDSIREAFVAKLQIKLVGKEL